MTPEWGSLPLLPLRCILDHLSLKDALAAMSVCRHWRSAVLLYEGHKDCLKLRPKQLDKCMYLTRLFRKHTKRLHILLDCSIEDLDKFMSYVLPQFFDTIDLQELTFVGPSYLLANSSLPCAKLKRIIIETFIHKHSHSLRKLSILNCEIDAANETDRLIHQQIEYYSRALTFNYVSSPCDVILSRSNIGHMAFSTLQHLSVDHVHINTSALETLSELTNFSRLTLNVSYKRHMTYSHIDWDRLDACYPNRLEVLVNIIGFPQHRLHDVIENVLREQMALISIKVLFCKTIYPPLIEYVALHYKDTLQEIVWADCPFDSCDPYMRIVRHTYRTREINPLTICNVNPFILLCWQCTQLRRLAIHGYWVWQYDLLGFARLRKSLCSIQVSSLYARQNTFSGVDSAVRVMASDSPLPVDDQFVEEMNEYTEFKWKPIPWKKLHPGLRARATPFQRADYVLREALQPFGVT